MAVVDDEDFGVAFGRGLWRDFEVDLARLRVEQIGGDATDEDLDAANCFRWIGGVDFAAGRGAEVRSVNGHEHPGREGDGSGAVRRQYSGAGEGWSGREFPFGGGNDVAWGKPHNEGGVDGVAAFQERVERDVETVLDAKEFLQNGYKFITFPRIDVGDNEPKRGGGGRGEGVYVEYLEPFPFRGCGRELDIVERAAFGYGADEDVPFPGAYVFEDNAKLRLGRGTVVRNPEPETVGRGSPENRIGGEGIPRRDRE